MQTRVIQVHYEPCNVLACHINTHVKRRRQNISIMKTHLMRLFPITFQLNLNLLDLAYPEQRLGGRQKSLKASPTHR